MGTKLEEKFGLTGNNTLIVYSNLIIKKIDDLSQNQIIMMPPSRWHDVNVNKLAEQQAAQAK